MIVKGLGTCSMGGGGGIVYYNVIISLDSYVVFAIPGKHVFILDLGNKSRLNGHRFQVVSSHFIWVKKG